MTRIVCLLPVRNGERDLPGYLESVGRFADAVVALDDGSTDRTGEILEASPLVAVLLENPLRPSYEGWDDSANRNRLLEAAGALEPEWIVSMDADERMDEDDAAALRLFVETDALRLCAYGFQHHRAWHGRYEPRFRWIYRLFPFEPGQSFPTDRLHFDPIPTSIPRSRWLRTSIRVRHLAAESEERVRDRLRKYVEADPDGEYRTDFGGLDKPPADELVEWSPRPGGIPILVGSYEATADLLPPPDAADEAGWDHEVVCLLPVRNGERDLPGYLESVGRFADAVVALDDGSTDRTREILDASPLVKVVIENPPRPSYAGWDDAANRSKLLEAAAGLHPRWIMWLDADERLDAGDAAALREFIRDARTDLAYQFLVHRMIGDTAHFDQAGLWVCRLFAFAPGQALPRQQLHFVPIPESIPRNRWVRTTLRIQHLAGLTEERRAERYAKYAEADPERAFQPDYAQILQPPGEIRPWTPRPPRAPVLHGGPGSRWILDPQRLDLDAPVLSAVIISRNDEATIERTVASVVGQDTVEPFEVIVVTSGSDRTAEIVRDRFPEVTLIELEGDALPGAARNAGVAVARGDYVSFPGSHVELPPGSLQARIRAHERGYPMVTGSVINGTRTAAGWASYFLDHSTALPGRPSGELRSAPAHCSYARDFLDEVGGFPEDMRAGEDTVVNRALFERGLRAYRADEVTLVHRSPCRDPGRLALHHFIRGRAFGRILLTDAAGDPRRAAGFLRGYLRRRLERTSSQVTRWGGDLREVYRRVRPLVALGACSALVGAWTQIGLEVSRRPSTASAPETGDRAGPRPIGRGQSLARMEMGGDQPETNPASLRSLARNR